MHTFAPSEIVRSNCTIALGDLAARFPNLLEPWTENMYSRLRDPSVSVRKNAVLVLSHLILNAMMKVKGYMSEMAMRLEDDDERICNLAKLFFHELSKKGSNPIYNLLSDILGKFSLQNLKRESFYNIMQFLIGSIKKEKQMEALVEKLCNRFSGVTANSRNSSAPPCPTLFVANLGPTCTEQELNQVFSRCRGFLKLKTQSTYGSPVAYVNFQAAQCVFFVIFSILYTWLYFLWTEASH